MSTIIEPRIPSLSALAAAFGPGSPKHQAAPGVKVKTSTAGPSPAPSDDVSRLAQSYAHAAEFSLHR